MRNITLAGMFALVASTSLAQTDTAPRPAAPQNEAPTPAVPGVAGPNDAAATQQAAKGQPANLCQELLAFVKAPPTPPAAPAQKPPAALPSAVSRPTLSDTAAAGEQTAAAPAQPAQQGSVQADKQAAGAAQDSAPASGKAVPPQSPGKSESAQEVSGQSGPAHGAPEPNAKAAAQGNVQNAPQTSSLSAPVPTEPAKTAVESVLSLAQAEELATAKDIAACQEAARKLRLAGAPMPPPLLALMALDLRYQR